jgi:hypothetical protein
MGDVYGLLLVSDPAREDNAGSKVESSTVSELFSKVSFLNEYHRAIRRAIARICRICDGLQVHRDRVFAFRQTLNVASVRRARLFTLRRDALGAGTRTPRFH